jgi:hypothetical protein
VAHPEILVPIVLGVGFLVLVLIRPVWRKLFFEALFHPRRDVRVEIWGKKIEIVPGPSAEQSSPTPQYR